VRDSQNRVSSHCVGTSAIVIVSGEEEAGRTHYATVATAIMISAVRPVTALGWVWKKWNRCFGPPYQAKSSCVWYTEAPDMTSGDTEVARAGDGVWSRKAESGTENTESTSSGFRSGCAVDRQYILSS
jgi:hypothetical protein